MRRLFSVGLISLGGFVAATGACGSESGDNTFNGGDAGSDAPFGTSGFNPGTTTSSTSGTSGDPIPDSGPIIDAPVPACGNSILDGDDECDDGNPTPDDGCSASCKVEDGYVCNIPGQPCAKIGACGDGVLKEGEECDDKTTVGGDGCTADCKLEPGWACPIPGVACVAEKCGDGIIAGDEECDDGANGAGCSNQCLLEPGYKCPTPGAKCVPTTCGDGQIEGTEQCDDDNTLPYDGCSPTCTKEPVCPKAGGACAGACGDGIVFPGEECDDGNTKDGDGCSKDCKQEPGFECTLAPESLPNEIDVPIIYRDFSRGDKDGVCAPDGCANGHPDMDTYSATVRGIAGFALDATGQNATNLGRLDGTDGKPIYGCPFTSGTNDCTVTSATTFNQWYRDLPGNGTTTRVNYTIPRNLPLTRLSAGTYRFTSNAFFPINGLGFGNQYEDGNSGGDNNFHFTSELRFWFKYDQEAIDSPPQFDFTGDDDVFVYVNGILVVDLGGVHTAQDGSVTINPATAAKLGLEKDKVYEFALFQAERNRSQSNYTATFKGFARAKSVCVPKCGDGVKTKFEVCDDGANNDTNDPPGYGKCAKDCKSRGPFCGDGTTQDPPEKCDDGPYNGGYDKCKVDCSGPGPRCGDGVIDAIYGEICDDGPNNDTNVPPAAPAYGKCSSNCRAKPRCGDGIVQSPEQCDGAPVGGVACNNATCKLDTGGPK
ncbi:MAG: DUF4215 domain-containing protein [Labilithrix sp.]|nr:DUF4215 domain-containing protein [Labilithrix sp.]MCW5815944.1 DUF4215 domain-containing protein [Labilithrix sp.]